MKITLCKVTDDNRKLTKKLNNKKTIDGVVLKADASIINPTLRISGANISDLSSYNYLYIPSMYRYYFINDITIVTGNIIEIRCHVDVLQSFNSGIKNLKTLIDRQEYIYNTYIEDNQLRVREDRQTNIYSCGSFSAPSDNYFALTVSGGGN